MNHRIVRIACALAAGVLLHWVVGLDPWWPAAWIAPVLLLVPAFRAGNKEAGYLAMLAAAIGLAPNAPYFLTTTGPILTPVILILQVMAWGFVVRLTRNFVVNSRHWTVTFVYPLVWAALDTVIGFLSPHGSFSSLAYSQMDALPVIQIASIAGTPGIVFLMSLGPSIVAVALFRGRRIPLPAFAYGLPLAVLAGALAFGFLQLARPAGGKTVRAGLASIDDYLGPRTPESAMTAVWARYAAMIADLAQRGARVVVLPEKITAFDPATAQQRRDWLGSLAAKHNLYLLAGVQINFADRRENVAWLFHPSGRLIEYYVKHHLVPGLESDLTPGRDFALAQLDATPMGIAICKDSHFPALGREYGRRHTAALLIPAWDFQRDRWIAARLGVLRGVENGYAILRSSREGNLIASDARGRVVAEQASSELPGTSLTAEVPIGDAQPTVYSRIGDLFGWLCVTLSVLARWRLR